MYKVILRPEDVEAQARTDAILAKHKPAKPPASPAVSTGPTKSLEEAFGPKAAARMRGEAARLARGDGDLDK